MDFPVNGLSKHNMLKAMWVYFKEYFKVAFPGTSRSQGSTSKIRIIKMSTRILI